MRRKLSIIIAILVCVASTSAAQSLKFSPDSWDFGTISEDGGVVNHTFEYKNVSNKPIVVVMVRTSCGCTTPEYGREPLKVGESATMRITYDPMGRPGVFNRTISVMTSADSSPIPIYIKGDVTPRVKSTEELFPFDMGQGLRLGANYFAMSYIEHSQFKQSAIEMINMSGKSVDIELRPVKSSGYLIIKPRMTVAAGEKVSLPFSYLVSAESGYYGSLADSFDLYINGEQARYGISMNGHAVDKFESGAPTASAAISSKVLRMGRVARNDKSATAQFTIENSGTEPLIVRRVDAEAPLKFSRTLEGLVIGSGDRVLIEVQIDPSQVEYGLFSRYITFTFNDSERPMQRVRVSGEVYEP